MEIEELKRKHLNLDFAERSFEVQQESMLEFAAACGETAPRYTDPAHGDFQATPTFCARFHRIQFLLRKRRQYGKDFDRRR